MTVIPLPLPQRWCWDCEHHINQVQPDTEGLASFCSLWGEVLDDERVAADCDDFIR